MINIAFSSAITQFVSLGNKKASFGTYTNAGGDTGGNIDTGLDRCEFMVLQERGTAVATGRSVVNETFPAAGNAVTIVNDDDNDGVWFAFGKG